MSEDKKQLAKIALEQRAVAVTREEPYQVTAEALRALETRFGVASVDLSRVQFPLALLELIPREIAEMYRLLPIEDTGSALRVAMEDPTNQKSIDELSFVVGKDIVPLAVPAIDLEATLHAAYVASQRGERYFIGPRYEGPPPRSTGLSLAEFIPVRRESQNAEPAPAPAAPLAPAPAAPPAPVAAAPAEERVAEPEAELAFEIPDLDLDGEAPAPVAPVAAKPPVPPARGKAPRPESRAAAAKPTVEPTGPLVLLVEDHLEVSDLMRQWLTDAGYRVLTAPDGEAAVEVLKRESPELLVLDAVLPGLHGFDLVRRLKASRRYANVPIVMVSGLHRGWSLEVDLRELGVADYLEKPIRSGQLLRAVSKALGQKPRGLRSAAAESLQAGLSAFKQGQPERALEYLERAAELDPDAPELHFHLGLLRGQRGQLFEAIASLERAVELEGRDFPTIKNLAILYQQAGFLNRSRELWQRALHLAPDQATRSSIEERLRTLVE